MNTPPLPARPLPAGAPPARSPPARSWLTRQRFAQCVVAAVVLWGLVAAVQVVVPAARADLAIIQTRWHIEQWATGKAPQPGIVAWGKARNAVADALQLTPNDPNLHENLADLYASRAQASAFVPELARDFLLQALASYQRAAQLRPMSGPTWANVAQSLHTLYPSTSTSSAPEASPTPGQATPEQLATLWAAFDKAMAYGQREASVQLTLAHIGFARWATLTPQRQQALLAMASLANGETHLRLEAIAQQHGQASQLPPPSQQPNLRLDQRLNQQPDQ